jgi:hypothetical protein
MGLVLDNKIKRRYHILTEEKLEDIGARSELLSRKSWQNYPSS